MLIIILFYVSITFTCLWAGFLADFLFSKLKNPADAPPAEKNWIIYALWGMVSIAIFAQVLQLFVPVNPVTWLLFIAGLSLLSASKKALFSRFLAWLKNAKRLERHAFLFCAMLVVLFAMLAAGPTQMDDTESYHMQNIKWTQAYGTVKGIANLHERFGFNSSWLTFTSLFIPQHSAINYFNVVNSLLSLWFSIYLYTGFRNALNTNREPGQKATYLSFFFMFMVALLIWPMLRGNATNSNYDFVTSTMFVVLFVEVLKQKNTWQDLIPELLIWPAFLFTVRIINFPILLVTLFAIVVLARQNRIKLLMISLAVSGTLVLAFLTRNVLLSGYLFYPAYQLDVFSVDWKADPVLTKDLVTYIRYFNRVNAGFQPIAETARLGFPGWIPVWFRFLFSYDKVLLALSLAGYLALFFRTGWRTQLNLPAKLIIGVSALQLLSWFFIAPDPRFIYGPLLLGTFFLPWLLPGKLVESTVNNRRMIPGVSIVLFGIMVLYSSGKVVRDGRYYNPVFPAALPVPKARLVTTGGVEYRIPEKLKGNWNARCCATPLPCLYSIQPGLSPRGTTIEEGFKLKK